MGTSTEISTGSAVESVALPWYRSTIIISALVSIITKILVVTGLVGEISPEDSEALTNTIVLLIGGVADLWAIKSRVVQQAAPKIVSTGKKALLTNAEATITSDPLSGVPEASAIFQAQPLTYNSGSGSGGGGTVNDEETERG